MRSKLICKGDANLLGLHGELRQNRLRYAYGHRNEGIDHEMSGHMTASSLFKRGLKGGTPSPAPNTPKVHSGRLACSNAWNGMHQSNSTCRSRDRQSDDDSTSHLHQGAAYLRHRNVRGYDLTLGTDTTQTLQNTCCCFLKFCDMLRSQHSGFSRSQQVIQVSHNTA